MKKLTKLVEITLNVVPDGPVDNDAALSIGTGNALLLKEPSFLIFAIS